MSDHAPHNPRRGPTPRALFTWRGDEVVLLADRDGDQWVVARGWLHGDRLVDVRRWSFPNPRALTGQVRRLAREATGNATIAEQAAASVIAWVAGQSDTPFDSGT